jgi:hypothetical protein
MTTEGGWMNYDVEQLKSLLTLAADALEEGIRPADQSQEITELVAELRKAAE